MFGEGISFFLCPLSPSHHALLLCSLTLAVPIMCNRRVNKWASYVHPGLHTLGIASTQRVESSNSALKLVVSRSGTMVDVNTAIVGKVQDDAIKSVRWALLDTGFCLRPRSISVSSKSMVANDPHATGHQDSTLFALCKSVVARRRQVAACHSKDIFRYSKHMLFN